MFLALKEFQDLSVGKLILIATDNTKVVSYINKEGGMRSGPLCALLWRILTWCTVKQVTLRARHIPGHLNVVADKLSRLGQTIQTEWSLLPEVFRPCASNRSLCHEIQQQTAPVCVTSSRPHGHCSGCTQSTMGKSGCLCLPTDSHIGQSGGEVARLSIPEVDSYCSRVAQHAMVLGPSGDVQSHSTSSCPNCPTS